MHSILRALLLPASIFVFAAVLYVNTVQNDFIQDDATLIPGNPLVHSLHNIPKLFITDYWQPMVKAGLYRPLVTTSYALNFWFAGADPASYHAVNVLLHALVAVLVLFLFRLLTRDVLVSMAGALLFAAHAVHTEAVAGVIGRAELMAALFLLSSLLCHIKAEEGRAGRSIPLYLASLAAYLLALLCKEIAVTLLGVVLLYDLVYSAEGGMHQKLRGLAKRFRSVYGGYLLVALIYLTVRHLVLSSGAPINPTSNLDNALVDLDFGLRALNALQVAFRYLGLLAFPLHLSYDYSYGAIPILQSFSDPRSLAALALGALAVWIVLWRSRLSRPVFFALGFAIVTFSVVSNVAFPIGTILGERLLYIPSIGFCLGVAVALRRLSEVAGRSPGAGRAVFIGIFALIVGLHGWRTVVRNLDWRSHERLFLHDLEVNPGSTKIRSNAAGVLLTLERYEDAIVQSEKAIEIKPDYHTPYGLWGHALIQLGRQDEAIEKYELAIRYGGGDPSENGTVFNNLGFLLVEKSIDPERGVQLLELALEADPQNPHVLDSLGWSYYKTGRLRKAHDLVRRSLEIDDSGPSGDERRAHLEEIEQALRNVGLP
jgi:tetratricopeptide (TPR) repeat protein